MIYIYVHGIARKHQLELQCSCQDRLEADTPEKKKNKKVDSEQTPDSGP